MLIHECHVNAIHVPEGGKLQETAPRKQVKASRKDKAASVDDDSDWDLPEGEPLPNCTDVEEDLHKSDDEAVASTSEEGRLPQLWHSMIPPCMPFI